MKTRSQDGLAQEDVEIDLRGFEREAETWVTVSEASARSGLAGATIRQLYRSGRIPTQRAAGDRGAFLVPLTAVLRIGDEADADGDDLGEPILDINATYWSIETQAAREEAASAQAALDEARRQVAFLREQLAEATAAERAATARADALEAEAAALRRISRASASITDPSWLDLSTNGYGSPVRGQALPALAVVEPLVGETGIDGPGDDALAQALAEATGATVADVTVTVVPVPEAQASAELDGDAEGEVELEVDAPKVQHPRPGEHADDLLPASEKRSRRGRR